jgi:pimeloyl-ACP methyl ester carboxylesterase
VCHDLLETEDLKVRLSVRQFEAAAASPSGKPDVVLIHGTGADGTLWSPQIEALTKEGHRCFVPELRGHGLTHEPEEPTSIDVHIVDLLETLGDLNITYPAIWIGHSLGAIILMQLAKQRPEIFVQIIGVGLPGKVPPVVTKLFGWFLCTPFEALRGTFWQRQLSVRHRILIDTERHSLEQIVEHFSTINLVDQEHNIDCPVHLSVGRFDIVAPYFYSRKIHRTLPNSTFRIFEWAGHSCMDDRPDQFNDWLMEHVRSGTQLVLEQSLPTASANQV